MQTEALFTLSYGLYVVSSKQKGRFNGQIADVVAQVSLPPERVTLAINKQNLTHEFITESGVAVVSVLSEKTPLEFIGRFGFKSGRDLDKFAGLAVGMTNSGCAYPLDHTLAYIELAVVDQVDVGSHTLFICSFEDGRLLAEGRPMSYAYYQEVLRGRTPPTAPQSRPTADQADTKPAAQARAAYRCSVCGYIYDPAKGVPETGVAPGTAFQALPDDWVCPVCGAPKSAFKPVD